MNGTLLLNILNVRSNFVEDIELPAGDEPETDTNQYWIGPAMTFSITTHAINRDIRIYGLRNKEGATTQELVNVLAGISDQNYGDVIHKRVVIEFENALDDEEVREKFAAFGLEPTIGIRDGAFLFWRYGNGEYQNLSDPEQSVPAG